MIEHVGQIKPCQTPGEEGKHFQIHLLAYSELLSKLVFIFCHGLLFLVLFVCFVFEVDIVYHVPLLTVIAQTS